MKISICNSWSAKNKEEEEKLPISYLIFEGDDNFVILKQ